MSAYHELIRNHQFVNEAGLQKAIQLVELAVTKENESSEQQNLLDEAHDWLDTDLVRDFSGLITQDPTHLVEIVKNAFVIDHFAVELHEENGESQFSYLSATDTLTFLKTAQANMSKQVANVAEAIMANAAANKAKKTRKYKAVLNDVVSRFNEEVVTMLGSVAGKDLSLNLANVDGSVFADPVTDALFYAWSCGDKHADVNANCLYDYLATGDKNLLFNIK